MYSDKYIIHEMMVYVKLFTDKFLNKKWRCRGASWLECSGFYPDRRCEAGSERVGLAILANTKNINVIVGKITFNLFLFYRISLSW